MPGGVTIKKILITIIIIILSVIIGIKQSTINELQLENARLSEQLNLQILGDGVVAHGQLRVEGTNLVDQNGKVMQLRGMSTHGLLWYPQYTNYGAIKTTKDFGANVFRIAVYTDQSKGYVNNPEETKLFFYMALENVLAADMYAIVDWHVLRDRDPNVHIDLAIEFFEEVSRRYANHPAIIYEICNEPNGDTTWDDVKAYAETVIPVIRKNSPDALIVVGTPRFSTDLKSVYGKLLDFDNVMYAYHQYMGVSGRSYQKAIEGAWSQGMPIFVSEWGFDNKAEDINALLEGAELFLDYLNKHNISWVNWSLANKAEGSAAILDSSTKLSGWDLDELTKSGRFVFQALGR